MKKFRKMGPSSVPGVKLRALNHLLVNPQWGAAYVVQTFGPYFRPVIAAFFAFQNVFLKTAFQFFCQF
jgi:hypothetical protein